jgi:hypothetical protein
MEQLSSQMEVNNNRAIEWHRSKVLELSSQGTVVGDTIRFVEESVRSPTTNTHPTRTETFQFKR